MFTAEDQPKARKCAPWLPEEMIHVEGFPLVYTCSKLEGIEVHFPGGFSHSLDTLRLRGLRVTMPRLMRTMQTIPV